MANRFLTAGKSALTSPRTTQKLLRTAEVGLGAYASQALAGKLGLGKFLPQVPPQLGIAFALFGASLVVPGKRSEDVYHLGEGALAAYLSDLGRQMGGTMAAAGYEIGNEPRPLSEAELLRAAGLQ